MKLSIILFASFIAFAFCSAELSEAPQDHRKIDDLRNFFNTLYKHFNLSEPEHLVSCFNDKTATLFFNTLYEFHEILSDTCERKQVRLHIDYLKLLILMRSLRSIQECVVMTRDYYNLIEALNISDLSPQEILIAKFIYYQAEFDDLLEDFTPIIDGLEKKDHRAAGIAYAKLMRNMVANTKKEGIFFLANQGFLNGFAVRLGLNNPSDSLECWDNKTSGYYLEFMLKLSEAITSGSWYESPVNTQFFWRNIGKDIMKKIPSSVWDCLSKSNDNKQFIDEFGLDFYDESFDELFLRYINNHRLSYFMTMKGIKHGFDHYNFGHAGYVYAHFIKQLANANSTRMELLENVSF